MHSIKVRLTLLVCCSALALVLVGASGWFGLQRLTDALHRISNRDMPILNSLMAMRVALLDAQVFGHQGAGWNINQFREIADEGGGDVVLDEAHGFFNFAYEGIDRAITSGAAAFEIYDRLPKSAEEAALWEPLKARWSAARSQQEVVRDAIGDLRKAANWRFVEISFPMLRIQTEGLSGDVAVELEKLIAVASREAAFASDRGEAARANAGLLMAVVFLIAIVGLAAMAWLTVRIVAGSLESMRQAIVQIADSKDFTRRVAIMGRDEVGQTAQAFNALIDSMQTALQAILEDVVRLSEAARQAATAARTVSESSASQIEAASAMAIAVEAMTASISHLLEGSREALARAHDAGSAADEGIYVIDQSNRGMERIAETVDGSTRTIDSVGHQSTRISLITQVIQDVTAQTNLLALNAAIEAARAGEQGRGFAVVADEVRKLAERSSRSADEIGDVIRTMQGAANEAVGGMSSIVMQVQSGKERSARVMSCMETIQACAGRVTDAVGGIAGALEEQGAAAQDIAGRVDTVLQMSEENHCAAARTAEVARELDGLVESLRAATRRFTV